MPGTSQNLEWLSLVEVSGPFLAATVLDDAFPQGMESVDTPRRQRLRTAYEEWRDAVDQDDPLLPSLHQGWVRMVLADLLEYDAESLVAPDWDGEPPSVKSDDGAFVFQPTWVIKSPSTNRARSFITVVPPDTDLDSSGRGSSWAATLREQMTALCRSHDIRVGLLTNGEQWMVVNAPADSTSGQASWYARFWFQEPITLRAFHSLLNVRRCFGPADSTLEAFLEESIKHQDEVTDTLGEQVRRAVEVLIQALDRADEDRNRELLRDVAPSELYEAGLTVMMRLVFLLCAEERHLLLLGDPVYDEFYAVSTLRGQLASEVDLLGSEILERRQDAWSRLLALFRGIYGGIEHEDLRLPAMGGSLFDPDRFPFLEGRAKDTSWADAPAEPLPIDNRTVLLLMNSLQVLEQAKGALTLSYRALDVEQIGYVYEGLLEHTVVRVPGITLGLRGTATDRYPSVPLAQLESARLDGIDKVVELVAASTGRSVPSIRADLARPVNTDLIAACGGDDALRQRLVPFANLLRVDARNEPVVYPERAFMVTGGSERRETGTHYTPMVLTEQIVKVTLEPAVYSGPAEGSPRTDWVLKPPSALLSLKVCDPTMGSGAFLVQACRYLADRLIESWSQAEANGLRVAIDGNMTTGNGHGVEPMPVNPEERQLTARRLVAERCLYGVDVNPMAVELAKLSVWLVTLAKGKPFGFLDHNFKSGDSLLGLHDARQASQLTMKPEEGVFQPGIFGHQVEDAVANAVNIRLQIASIQVRDITDVQTMALLNRKAEGVIGIVEQVADCLVGEALVSTDSSATLSEGRERLAFWADQLFTGNEEARKQLANRVTWLMTEGLPGGSRARRPFHWALEFPEVFNNGGFDAIIGNPPFLGNRLWKSMLGTRMQSEARMVLGAAPGKIDLCVVFHRRAAQLLRSGGCYGLLGRDSMTEGSAVKAGLGVITTENDIYFARKRVPWPGKASVVTAVVCCFKGDWHGVRLLNGSHCEQIGPRLEPDASDDQWTPRRLSNAPLVFLGVNNGKGMAFILGEDDPWLRVLQDEPASLLRPYISGNDITNSGLEAVSRWALDIGDRSLEEIQDKWPIAYQFLTEVVQPTRTPELLKSERGLIDRWWQFWNHRAGLLRELRKQEEFIAFPVVAKYPVCLIATTAWIYTNKVAQISWNRPDLYAICLSSVFRDWLYYLSIRSLGADANTLQLSVSEAMLTFPLPAEEVSMKGISAAASFDHHARAWCRAETRGLTDLMNQVHSRECSDQRIAHIRTLLNTVDSEVVRAYDWLEIDTSACFRGSDTSSQERWRVSDDSSAAIKQRLLALNEAQFKVQTTVRSGGRGRGRRSMEATA